MTIHRRALWHLPSLEPKPAGLQNSWPPYDGRLIANLELNLRLTGCKTNHIQFSYRKFSAVFCAKFRSQHRELLVPQLR